MQYKTIVLEMIQARPALHEQLRSSNILLSEMEQYAQMLRSLHLASVAQLRSGHPAAAEIQLHSQAMELAMAEMEVLLNNRTDELTRQEVSESEFSLDAAMAYLKQQTPNKN